MNAISTRRWWAQSFAGMAIGLVLLYAALWVLCLALGWPLQRALIYTVVWGGCHTIGILIGGYRRYHRRRAAGDVPSARSASNVRVMLLTLGIALCVGAGMVCIVKFRRLEGVWLLMAAAGLAVNLFFYVWRHSSEA